MHLRSLRRPLIMTAGIVACSFLPSTAALAAEEEPLTVTVNKVTDKGVGEKIGTIELSNNEFGLILDPDIEGLSPGAHGFHIHQNPDCGAKGPDGSTGAALAAGGHYDPAEAKHHDAPWADGHIGDMPVIVFDDSGKADRPVSAPRLSVGTVTGRSLVIHQGGDNYSDEPEKLGGGGPRVACAVIKR